MSEAKNHITVDQDSSVGDILINVHEKKVDIIKSLQKYKTAKLQKHKVRMNGSLALHLPLVT